MKRANTAAVKDGTNKKKVNPLKWAYELLYHEDVYRRMGGFLLWGFVLLFALMGCRLFPGQEPYSSGEFFCAEDLR